VTPVLPTSPLTPPPVAADGHGARPALEGVPS
jgi:hypothetical protein